MKKNLLTISLIFASVALMAQAYTYSPFEGAKYVVPDEKFNGLESLDALEAKSVDGVNENKQDLGLVWSKFDQAADPSTFEADWGKTVGANAGIVSEDGGGGAIRAWTYPDPYVFDYAVAKQNGNPLSPRIGGGWYMYTVNFAEVKDYSLVLRVRGFFTTDSLIQQDFNKYVVTIHDKSNIATVLHTWNVDLKGMIFTDEGSKDSFSEDKKFKNLGKARAGLSGQATTFWALNVNADERFKPTAAGDYVVKVSHLTGTTYVANAACGGISFYVGDLPAGGDTYAHKLTDNLIEVKYYNGILKIAGVNGNAKVNIYNTVGALVYQNSINGDFENELTLSKGIYLVNTSDASGRGVTTKIAVQ